MKQNSRKDPEGAGVLGIRWKSAFKGVKSLGFQMFDKDAKSDTKSAEHSPAHRGSADGQDRSRKNSVELTDGKKGRRHGSSSHEPVLLETHHLVELIEKSSCNACNQPVGGAFGPGLRCKQCRVCLHSDCEKKFKQECDVAVPGRGAKQLKQQNSAGSDDSALKTDDYDDYDEDVERGGKDVDPIYLMLKKASNMRASRSANIPDIVTDDHNVSSANRGTRERSAESADASRLALPKRTATKRADSPKLEPDGLTVGKTTEKPQKPVKGKLAKQPDVKPPKLMESMKSLSLDSPDVQPYYPSGRQTAAYLGNRTAPLSKAFNSIETSDERSSTSCSPCPSSQGGSLNPIPQGHYVIAMQDYDAKFPEEIDLRAGERILVLDTSDPEWWQGNKQDGTVGLFPVVAVAKLQPNEKLVQILQNLQLREGNKVLRLYRDQLVFYRYEEPDGFVWIRTADDYRAKCPSQYLLFLE